MQSPARLKYLMPPAVCGPLAFDGVPHGEMLCLLSRTVHDAVITHMQTTTAMEACLQLLLRALFGAGVDDAVRRANMQLLEEMRAKIEALPLCNGCKWPLEQFDNECNNDFDVRRYEFAKFFFKGTPWKIALFVQDELPHACVDVYHLVFYMSELALFALRLQQRLSVPSHSMVLMWKRTNVFFENATATSLEDVLLVVQNYINATMLENIADNL